MNLLMINGNTTQAVTDTVVTQARRIAAPGTGIVGVTATFGASIVTREAENVIAGHAVLDLLARHHQGFDAAILAISFDTALTAARQISPIPVIGMTESALLAAAEGAERIGIILFGSVSRPLYEDLFARSPVRERIAAVSVVEIGSVSAYLETGGLEAAILAEAARLAGAGIEAAVICGAAMAGMAERLQPRAALPLFDGIACAVRHAEALLRDRAALPVTTAPLVRNVSVSGLGPDLTRLMGASSQS